MRRVPLDAAKLLGLYASHYRFVPGLYILLAFVFVPGVCLGISALFDAHVAVGAIVLVLCLVAFGAFEFWWLIGCPIGNAGAYKVVSKEARQIGEAELAAANAAVKGEPTDPVETTSV